MPRLAKQPTHLQLSQARPGSKIACGNGLQLESKATGKRWYVRWRAPDGRRGKVMIGFFPDLSLADAKAEAERIHVSARTGAPIVGYRDKLKPDPTEPPKPDRTFAAASEAWLSTKTPRWAESTADKAKLIIRRYMQPAIGQTDMAELTSRQVRDALQALNERAPHLAAKATGYVRQVVDWAIVEGWRDEGRHIVTRGMVDAPEVRHFPAITEAGEIGHLWAAVQDYAGSHTVRAALMLCGWTAHRPGVVATARWEHVDISAGTWSVPGELMKMNKPHVVSLPRQALHMLAEVREYSRGQWVFPSFSRKVAAHISRDSLSKALRESGFRGRHVTHGFRAMLRTVAREEFGADVDALETQLAHRPAGPLAGAYDRTRLIEQRAQIMQRWADLLDEKAEEWRATQ